MRGQLRPQLRAAFVAAPARGGGVGAAPPSGTIAMMLEARRFARQCLWDARGDLLDTAAAIRAGRPLVPAQDNTFKHAFKWLNLNQAGSDLKGYAGHMEAAAALMLRNHDLKLPNGGNVPLIEEPGNRNFGEANLNRPDLGVRCGDAFFSPAGPNCRRDITVHEFFHLIGVEHGGGPLDAPTIRTAVRTPAQALNSADNLAQLVAALRTFKAENTDACARPND